MIGYLFVLLTCGIALVAVLKLDAWIGFRRTARPAAQQTPNWEIMDRFIGLDGKEYYYLRQWPTDGGGGGGDGGHGGGCGH